MFIFYFSPRAELGQKAEGKGRVIPAALCHFIWSLYLVAIITS